MPSSEKPEETTSTPKEPSEEEKKVSANRRKIGEDGAVPHPPLGLRVTGDGANDAHRTSPFLALFMVRRDVPVRFQGPREALWTVV